LFYRRCHETPEGSTAEARQARPVARSVYLVGVVDGFVDAVVALPLSV